MGRNLVGIGALAFEVEQLALECLAVVDVGKAAVVLFVSEWAALVFY